MLSANESKSFLAEQIHYQTFPSAPQQNFSSMMNNFIQDQHWIEFDIDLYLSTIRIDFIKQTFVIVDLQDENHLLKLFDNVLTLNEIELKGKTKEIVQCLFDVHQGKRVSMRIRRLQPSNTETIEFNLKKTKTLGFTIDSAKESNFDPGLFVVGIKTKGLAAKNGRLRVDDRLLQITNRYTTVNLQCLELSAALKLIRRMKNESKMIKILVAHRCES